MLGQQKGEQGEKKGPPGKTETTKRRVRNRVRGWKKKLHPLTKKSERENEGVGAKKKQA